ncbi:hypothetical protein [Planococcus alpniumensis]|uniref:hypothetical protein n=1 Tax=Planococcus alpniumensis TaxID=2708345 RepID=UPI001B8D00F4|nr:hypothetical protein [Planococcus sp. MSAK28401]
MNSGIMESLIVYAPIVFLFFACIGIVWSLLGNRKYLIGSIIMLLGVGVYYWGLYVGEWEGMGVSLFLGGGMLLTGILTLLITFLYSKSRATKNNREV